jgi:hypothetical protein
VLAHAGALIGVVCSSRGLGFLLGLNTTVALSVLLYSATRMRYILAAVDWPYLGLIAFECLVLAGALWAFKEGRAAVIGSYVAFGLHGCASIAAVIFAFTFKISKLM